MENSKTIVCPNCGAVSSNLDNCEYCGSILIKIASVLTSTSGDTKTELKDLGFGKSVYVSPEILGKVEQCIALSEKLNITTFIKMRLMEFCYSSAHSSVLKLCFNMQDHRYNSMFTRFENKRIAKIFEISQNGHWIYGSVTLDNDTRTIVQLMQYILSEICLTSDANVSITPVATYLNNHRYIFGSENKSPVEFVFDKDLKYSDSYINGLNLNYYFYTSCMEALKKSSYTFYINVITMKQPYSWWLYLPDFSKGIYDKALYDIVFADPILRCKVDESYKKMIDNSTQLALSYRVIWGSEESKQKYIAKCKEICSRSYYSKNIYPKNSEYINFGIISEDYDPQAYGPIEEYIKKEEKKMHNEAASDAQKIANEMQERHQVAVVKSNSGCLPILMPIVVIMGIIGYLII